MQPIRGDLWYIFQQLHEILYYNVCKTGLNYGFHKFPDKILILWTTFNVFALLKITITCQNMRTVGSYSNHCEH